MGEGLPRLQLQEAAATVGVARKTGQPVRPCWDRGWWYPFYVVVMLVSLMYLKRICSTNIGARRGVDWRREMRVRKVCKSLNTPQI
jgi:hypothetical protein